tara:strand:- start:47 stop:340 length:294 start_codon:yes stop_codon:yes gene_type:complete
MANLLDTRVTTTGFLKIPSGTVAQRPTGLSAGDVGMIRICTDFPGFSDPVVEYYNGTEWKSLYTPVTSGSGGTVTNVGSYAIHSFTSGSSSFVVEQQ